MPKARRGVSGQNLTPDTPHLAPSFYAQWRVGSGAAIILRDWQDMPPERLLQAIWQHQRLRRDQLKTLDGQSVRLLHPGFANAESGPDFRDALVQIGDAAPRSGDVEVDIRVAGWRAHGHDRNPAFRNVVLHVVWEGELRREPRVASQGSPAVGGGDPLDPRRSTTSVPPATLALREFLDAPLGELSLWLEREPVKSLPENLRGKCSAPLAALAPAQLTELLREAAHTRLQAKAAQFQARARHAGWEQVLWEGLFRALGYKHNVWPMQGLAETRSRWARDAQSALNLQARLLGISGLLPAELTRAPADASRYLRRVWDCWWRERDEFEDCLLPRNLWRFHGLRPANHPQRRLALAAHWLFAGEMAMRLERWCTAPIPDQALLHSLLEIVQVNRDDFWSWHWTFRSARLRKSQPLLGATRVTDLAVNVILPWLWTRAGEGRNEKLQREIERRYFAWPPAEDNAVLRLARQRLLGGARRSVLRSAFAQQGLMQIVRDFCNHSNAVCEDCPFPRLVKDWIGDKTTA